ncbi:cytochrome C oxidase subunit II [Marinicrinis lubricantis]|uniref:Cytochrome C oxidase subunit II n=1 Tax=Marinicrinis lubricantis TaxID=2086470 RepID=A0ABW1ILH3_9BACL
MKKWMGLIIAFTLVFSLAACGGNGDSDTSNAAVETNESGATELKIIATNWQFDQETYTISKDTPIDFVLDSQEGYHGVKIKGLGIELEKDNKKQYKITEAGEYEIVCNIICGAGHSEMKATLIVQ